MGDRTFVSFTITGHIPSVEALNDICEALAGHTIPDDPDSYRDDIATALEAGEQSVTFTEDERNYADMADEEYACQQHAVAFYCSWESGNDYEAGAKAFVPGIGLFEGAEGSVDVGAIKTALAAPDPLAAVRALVDASNLIDGEGHPGLSAAPEVLAHLQKSDGEVS